MGWDGMEWDGTMKICAIELSLVQQLPSVELESLLGGGYNIYITYNTSLLIVLSVLLQMLYGDIMARE